MRHIFKKIVFVAFALMLLVGAVGVTPAHATNDLFKAYMGWHNNFWTDEGSATVLTTMDNSTYRRTHDVVYHMRASVGNVFVDGNLQQDFDFHSNGTSSQHFYFFQKVVAYHAGGTFHPYLGGTLPGTVTGEFDSDFTGHWTHTAMNYINPSGVHPETGVDFMVYERFSLDPIVGDPFPYEPIPVGIYLDTNNWANHAVWESVLGDYITEVNRYLAPAGKMWYWNGITTLAVNAEAAFNFNSTGCHYNSYAGLKIWFTSTDISQSYGTDCDGNGTVVIDTRWNGANRTLPEYDLLVDDVGDGTTDYDYYWRTIIGLIHEFLHTRGGYASELYWFKQIPDNTGFLPDVDTNIASQDDKWWGDMLGNYYGGDYKHINMRRDPAIGWPFDLVAPMTTMRASLDHSLLTTDLISSDFAVGTNNTSGVYDMTANIQSIKVTQLWTDNSFAAGIRVKAWFIGNDFFPATTYIGDVITDQNGQAVFTIPATNRLTSRTTILLKSYYNYGQQLSCGSPQIVDVFNLQLLYYANRTATQYPINMVCKRPAARGDIDGNGTTDTAVYRPSDGNFYDRASGSYGLGVGGGIPVPGDYFVDGDQRATVFRNGEWHFLGISRYTMWGATGDIPVPADYDGNGTIDMAYYHPVDGTWHVKDQFTIQFGAAGDMPVQGDYNGDGITELAVFRPSSSIWFVRGGAIVGYQSGDIPVPGDYDGNGTTDIAVFRPSTAWWYVRNGLSVQYGQGGDMPIPGDYDGNGVTDIAVYRPSNHRWFVRNGTAYQWGGSGDWPIPAPDTNGDGDPYQ